MKNKAIKHFEIVSLAANDFITSARNNWDLNNDSFNRVKSACRQLDIICEKIEAESSEVTINKGDIEIIVTAPDIVFENGRDNIFFKMLDNVSKIEFSTPDGVLVSIKLIFRDVWRKQV